MATTHEMKVQRREDEGKGASRRLRHAGTVPAIVYGGELKPVSIQLNHNDVWLASQNDWFYASILDLNLNGDQQKVLLRDLQRHPFKQQIMHLDFQRVNENDALRVLCRCSSSTKPSSPARPSRGPRLRRTSLPAQDFLIHRDRRLLAGTAATCPTQCERVEITS